MVFGKKKEGPVVDDDLPPVLRPDDMAPPKEPTDGELALPGTKPVEPAEPTPPTLPEATEEEPPADIPVSPSDLADLIIGSVARFGPQVVRIGEVDRKAGTVRILREGGDPTSFFTASELRVMLLLKGDQSWPRVIALNAPPKPAKRLDET